MPEARAAAALVAVVLAALGALALAGARDERVVAGSVGLPAIRAAAEVPAGRPLCVPDIDAPAGFARVRLVTDGPGPALEVFVRRAGRPVARGRVGPGYGGGTVEARVGAVPSGSPVEVCVRSAEPAGVVLLGSPRGVLADRLADPELDPAPAVVLVRDRPVSTLGQLPEIVERAALFKPVGELLLWGILAAVLLGLPLLLLAALRASGP